MEEAWRDIFAFYIIFHIKTIFLLISLEFFLFFLLFFWSVFIIFCFSYHCLFLFMEWLLITDIAVRKKRNVSSNYTCSPSSPLSSCSQANDKLGKLIFRVMKSHCFCHHGNDMHWNPRQFLALYLFGNVCSYIKFMNWCCFADTLRPDLM